MNLKHVIRQVSIVGLAVMFGILIGSVLQHLRTGLHVSPLDSREWKSQFGTIKLEHLYETVGVHFLEPPLSRVSLHPESSPPVLLFECQPIFKESTSIVREIEIDDDSITWTDGVRTYSLKIVEN